MSRIRHFFFAILCLMDLKSLNCDLHGMVYEQDILWGILNTIQTLIQLKRGGCVYIYIAMICCGASLLREISACWTQRSWFWDHSSVNSLNIKPSCSPPADKSQYCTCPFWDFKRWSVDGYYKITNPWSTKRNKVFQAYQNPKLKMNYRVPVQ